MGTEDRGEAHGRSTPELTRSERIDLAVSRRLPAISRKLNVVAFKVSGGRVGGEKRGIPIGLLTVRGRRSGELRTVPLMYLLDGDRVLLVASNGGSDRPPAWWLNLRAAGVAEWRTRQGTSEVVTEQLEPRDHDAVWSRMVEHNPLWAAFQASTERRTSVVALRATSR